MRSQSVKSRFFGLFAFFIFLLLIQYHRGELLIFVATLAFGLLVMDSMSR